MSMPITGILILIYLLYCFFNHPDVLPRAVAFFIPFTATSIFNIESVPIGLAPSYIAMVLFMASGLFAGSAFSRYTVSKDHLLQVAAFIGFVSTALLSLLIPALFSDARDVAKHAPVSSLFTQTVYVCFGVITTVVLSFTFSQRNELERVLAAIRWSCMFVCFWAILQGICFYTHIPYPAVLFNNSVSKSADMFAQSLGGIVRLASVAVEPSVMVFSLLHFLAFGLSVVVLEPRMRTKTWVVPTAVTTLLILASTSSTGYLGLLLTIFLLGLRRPIQVIVGSIPVLVAFGIALFIFSGFRQILWDVTVEKNQSYSYMERMDAVRDSFELFFQNPIFGAGWGAVTPGDLFGTILGNSGMIGLATFLLAIMAMLVSLYSTSKRAAAVGDFRLRAYAIGAQSAIIVAFGCSMTSGMKYYFLDDWCYWAIAIAISSQRPRPAQATVAAATSSASSPSRSSVLAVARQTA